MLHLGTITYGLKEFVVMLDRTSQKAYIEEVVLTSQSFSEDITAHCKFIEDDNLAEDLARFAEEHKLTDMKERANELNDLKRLEWLMAKQGGRTSSPR